MIDIKLYVPGKEIKEIKAENVYVETKIGKIGILLEHMKLLTVLDIGKMEIEVERETEFFAVAGGILKVEDNRVEIFSASIEKKSEINKERASKSKTRAQKYLKEAEEGKEDINIIRAEASLMRAKNRLDIGG